MMNWLLKKRLSWIDLTLIIIMIGYICTYSIWYGLILCVVLAFLVDLLERKFVKVNNGEDINVN